MTINDAPPYEESRERIMVGEPLLYDDLARKLTPEGIKHLDDMGRLLSSAELELYCERLEPAAQKYFRKRYM